MDRGYVIIFHTLLFMAIIVAVLIGVVNPVISSYSSAQAAMSSKKSFLLADSATEEAVYRLKNAKQIGTSQTITLSQGSATIDVSTTGGGKSVTVNADANGFQRDLQVNISMGAGIAFNYGLQAGNGGVDMDGGSRVVGNIYANGNIDAISATITGTAVAADSAALTAAQTNDSPSTPASTIVFRNAAASQDFAQSFQFTEDSVINKFQFYIKKNGTPSDITLRIVADSAGSPSTTIIPVGSATLLSSQVTTSYGWVEVVLPTKPSVIADTTYWVVLDNSTQNASSYYTMGANNTYAAGTAKTGAYSGTWNATSLDGYFKIYTGGTTSLIGGASYVGGLTVGTAGVGNAWATTVRGTSAQGTIYCTTGTNNNKACNTSQGSPPSQPLPFSEANMQAWKDEALTGGTTSGNVTVGWAGATLGPQKITGNLLVNGGGTLILNGPLWVVGTVTLTGGGKLQLPSGYASYSETIISDSRISIAGGGSVGSGSSGSYLFLVSTSKCPNDIGCSGASAISISGGAGAIAANAQYGNVALSGGAAINAAVGDSISITGGSTVTYDQGLASPSFQSGPSGGWNLQDWTEI